MKNINKKTLLLIFSVMLTFNCSKDDQLEEQQEVVIDNIWRGTDVIFSKGSNDDWTSKNFQDSISPNVIFTRANKKSLFNIKMESESSSGSPLDTEWAIGSIDDIESLEFCKFTCISKGAPYDLVDQPLVVHLITDDIYISMVVKYWGGGKVGNRGAITYSRSSPIGYPDQDNDGVRDKIDQCSQTDTEVDINVFGCNF
jgi:hypothetical protein